MRYTQTLPCRTQDEWLASLPAIRVGRYGVIETAAGKLVAIHLRRWPKVISLPEFWPVGKRHHAGGADDRCWLYYNQPRGCPNFLALKYVISSRGTSIATALAAATVLDAIAEAKRTDAIVCDAANSRLSDRFLARQGWEAHKPQRWHRNFIKRFYGEYPLSELPVEGAANKSASILVAS